MKLPANPPAAWSDLELNFTALENQGIFVGDGVPTMVADQGNIYFRTDDPTTSGHRIYINTASGSNWTGIV